MAKFELIGRELKVISANNLKGISGKVVDETRATVVLRIKSDEKRLLKCGAMFEINGALVAGKQLLGTPAERFQK